MNLASIIISCACSVVTIVISASQIYSKAIKTTATKEDLDGIKQELKGCITDLSNKIDAINDDVSTIDKRLVVVEYILDVNKDKGGV